MPIEIKTTFFVRCDNCATCLRPPPYCAGDGPAPVSHFPTPLHAIHRALQAHWTITPTSILCPACTPPLKTASKET